MNQPLSEFPESEFARRRRRSQSALVREALLAAKAQSLRLWRGVERYGRDLWRQGRRYPRSFAFVGGAAVLSLVAAVTLSASDESRSMCPPSARVTSAKSNQAKAPAFLLLMDSVPHAAAGSRLEISYDVCGLPSGTPYKGKVLLAQKKAAPVKKGAAKPKPLVVTFRDKVEGPATRRQQQLQLGSLKPGSYVLELSVVDNRGRERKRAQKIVIKNS